MCLLTIVHIDQRWALLLWKSLPIEYWSWLLNIQDFCGPVIKSLVVWSQPQKSANTTYQRGFFPLQWASLLRHHRLFCILRKRPVQRLLQGEENGLTDFSINVAVGVERVADFVKEEWVVHGKKKKYCHLREGGIYNEFLNWK